VDRFCFHYFSNTCILAFQRFGHACHIDRFLGLANSQGEVQPHALSHFKPFGLRGWRKSSSPDFNGVLTRSKTGYLKQTCGVGGRYSHRSSFGAYYPDRRSRDCLCTRIGDRAAHTCQITLRI
jgi:hypothetical protein